MNDAQPVRDFAVALLACIVIVALFAAIGNW